MDTKTAAEKKLADLATEVGVSNTALAADNAAYSKARVDTVAAQMAYKVEADRPSANTAVLADLAALRALADKNIAANSFGRAYFVVLVMLDRLSRYAPLSVQEYKDLLNAAGVALAEASDVEAATKKNVDAAAVAQRADQQALSDMRANWRQLAINAIPAVLPGPAAPAVPVAPTASLTAAALGTPTVPVAPTAPSAMVEASDAEISYPL